MSCTIRLPTILSFITINYHWIYCFFAEKCYSLTTYNFTVITSGVRPFWEILQGSELSCYSYHGHVSDSCSSSSFFYTVIWISRCKLSIHPSTNIFKTMVLSSSLYFSAFISFCIFFCDKDFFDVYLITYLEYARPTWDTFKQCTIWKIQSVWSSFA